MFGLFKPPPKPLRLMAQDATDLATISALTQDAVLKVSNIVYDARARSLTLELNRFCHERDKALRANAGLRFDGVTAIQSRGFNPKDKVAVLSLLDISATPMTPIPLDQGEDELAHTITLRFAGTHDTDIRLEVEAIDAILVDVLAPRRVKSKPNHS